jgi:hypothetical protein
MSNIHTLPFLPVSMPALMEAAFFQSNDARLVRAGLWMMEAAWRSTKPGTIPAGFDTLATITRLSVSEVEKNFDLLTQGWTLQDGRFHHEQLEAVVLSVQERFGDELEVIAESALVACQGGDIDFELAPASVVKKKKRGKHAFPSTFVMDKTTSDRAFAEGYTSPELEKWLLSDFSDFAKSGDRRYADWQATLRNYLGSSITRSKFREKFGYTLGTVAPIELVKSFMQPSPSAGFGSPKDRLRAITSGNSARQQMPSFAQRTAEHNSGSMAYALNRRPVPSNQAPHYQSAQEGEVG